MKKMTLTLLLTLGLAAHSRGNYEASRSIGQVEAPIVEEILRSFSSNEASAPQTESRSWRADEDGDSRARRLFTESELILESVVTDPATPLIHPDLLLRDALRVIRNVLERLAERQREEVADPAPPEEPSPRMGPVHMTDGAMPPDAGAPQAPWPASHEVHNRTLREIAEQLRHLADRLETELLAGLHAADRREGVEQ